MLLLLMRLHLMLLRLLLAGQTEKSRGRGRGLGARKSFPCTVRSTRFEGGSRRGVERRRLRWGRRTFWPALSENVWRTWRGRPHSCDAPWTFSMFAGPPTYVIRNVRSCRWVVETFAPEHGEFARCPLAKVLLPVKQKSGGVWIWWDSSKRSRRPPCAGSSWLDAYNSRRAGRVRVEPQRFVSVQRLLRDSPLESDEKRLCFPF